MAAKRKNKRLTTLKSVGASIGSTLGKADRRAHQLAKSAADRSRKISKAGTLAKSELHAISKQIEALKSQLIKTTTRLKRALS